MAPIRDAFHRLKPALRWLLQWLRRRWRPVVVIIVGCVLLYLSLPYWPQVWSAYKDDPDTFTPFFTPIGALLVGLAAFGQWRTARLRHEAQTKADLQQRITESFSKAIEQLGSDKVEVRLGGIYGLERISKESPDDYWTVMETLTAFVRERARWREPQPGAAVLTLGSDPWPAGTQSNKAQPLPEPGTDIAAVLAVIRRRLGHEQEERRGWQLDLRDTDLRGAFLPGAHLEGADLPFAHLERAFLYGALSKTPSSEVRISKAPPSPRRISTAPPSPRRISKAPSSSGRISNAPTSAGRISTAPSSTGLTG